MNCAILLSKRATWQKEHPILIMGYHTNITMKGSSVQSELNKFQVFITSYEVFLLDFADVIINTPFQFVVVD
jgi:hypothetical protein